MMKTLNEKTLLKQSPKRDTLHGLCILVFIKSTHRNFCDVH